MSDINSGTTLEGLEAPVVPGTPSSPDEVTLLKSRNAGLDAKVTKLTVAEKLAIARADAAEAKLAEYETGKLGADEALRAQLAAANAKAEAAEKAASVALIKAQYPESFGELGDAVFGMSDEKLASLEARLTGAEDAGEEPATPRSNNGPKAAATTGTGKPLTIKDAEAEVVRLAKLAGFMR